MNLENYTPQNDCTVKPPPRTYRDMKGNLVTMVEHPYKTRAAFVLTGNVWTWKTWINYTGNKHEAILQMAKKLNATNWDFGQADHMEASRANY